MATFTSTTDGNLNDGGTYGNTSPGVAGTDYPDSDDICVVGADTTVTLAVDDEVLALKITGTGSPGTLVGGDNTITLNGATSNKPLDNDGVISGDLNVIITNTGVQQDGLLLDGMGSSGNINDLTINMANGTTANKTIGIASDHTFDGDFTITSGTFSTVFDGGDARGLTVTGGTSIESGGTLTCNASAISLGSGVKAGVPFGLNVSGGTFTGGTGTHTIGSIRFSSGTFVFSAGATELNGSETGSSLAFLYVNADVTHSSGTITVTTDVASNMLLFTTSLTLNNLIIDSGAVHKIWTEKTDGSNENTLTCAGYLTITDGTLGTKYSSQDVVNLTVTGTTTVGDGSAAADVATLTCNGSTMTLGSGIAGWGLHVKEGGTFNGGTGAHNMSSLANDNDSASDITLTTGITRINHEHEANNYCVKLFAGGTFAHGGGTINIEPVGTYVASVTRIYGFYAANTANNITLNAAGQTLHQDTPLIHMAGDLTITAGTWNTADTGGSAKNLTVAGDCNVTGTITMNASVVEVGSLTINDNGTCNATSNTITIDSETSGYAYRNLETDGTGFVHNDGEVLFTFGGVTILDNDDTSSFYDLTVNSNNLDLYIYGNLIVANDFRIRDGDVAADGGGNMGTITVDGDFDIGDVGSATFNTLGGYRMAKAHEFGSITIAAGGEFGATSGVTALNGNFLNYGTYTHNSGTLEITTDWVTINNATSTAATTLHNLTCTYSATLSDRTNPVVVENILSIASGKILYIRSHPSGGNPVTLTMGKSTATIVAEGGSITGAGIIDFNNTTAASTVQGASQIYPCVVSSSYDWNWDGMTGAGDVRIANLDYDPDVITGGNGTTITLEGDCEFDAVTVSSGDTLDLGGNRLECSDVFDVNGSMDMDGSLLYLEHILFSGGALTGSANIISTGNENVTLSASSGTYTYTNFMPLGTWNLPQNLIAFTNITNFISAGNVTGVNPMQVTNMRIPVGGTYNGSDQELKITGDFNIAGGLIGKSCFSTDNQGDAGYIVSTSDYRSSDSVGTLEAWIKPSTSASSIDTIFSSADDDGTDFFLFYLSDGKLIFSAGGEEILYDTAINDGNWHHVAVTVDATHTRLYVDGKLVAESTDHKWFSDTPNRSNVGIAMISWDSEGNETGYMFKGEIDEVRLWSTTRTVSDLRDNMFSEVATDATGLVGYWKLDTGTGATVYDSCTNTTDLDLTEYSTGKNGWAGAGGFTGGTSTLQFSKAGTQTFSYVDSEYIAGINVANGSTTILNDIVGNNHAIYVSGNFVVSGTLDNTIGEYCRMGNDFTTNSGVIDIANGTITGLSSIVQDTSGTMTLTAGSYCKFAQYNGVASLGADVTMAAVMQISYAGNSASPTINYNGYTITHKNTIRLYDNATWNIGSGSVLYDVSSGDGVSSVSSTILQAGPGATISGNTSASKTDFKSQNNWKVVGKCENLDVTGEELRVTGQVINCTGDIIQQHPSIDANQQLDYDTADDRDIHLGRDLDKNTELVT